MDHFDQQPMQRINKNVGQMHVELTQSMDCTFPDSKYLIKIDLDASFNNGVFAVASWRNRLKMNKVNFEGKTIEIFERMQKKANHKWSGILNDDVFYFLMEVAGRQNTTLLLSRIISLSLNCLVYDIR